MKQTILEELNRELEIAKKIEGRSYSEWKENRTNQHLSFWVKDASYVNGISESIKIVKGVKNE